MSMRRRILAATGAAALCAVSGMAWGQVETEGRIDAVTVYRGQALVTRVVDLPESGLQEIVVTDLPAVVVPASLYAEGAPGVEVRSIRYRQRAIAQDTREEVRVLDEQIAALEALQRENAARSALIAQQEAYIASLEQFTGATATAELRSGVLDADTIRSLSELVFTERSRLSEDRFAQAERARELEAELEVVRRERAMVAGRTANTVREAVLLVESDEPGEVSLRYLVERASWTPSYTVRTDGERMGLEYFASIQQLSGEDWVDVEMTLSTASPSLVSMGPTLEPLELSLAQMHPDAALSRDAGERGRLELGRQQQTMESRRGAYLPQGATAAVGGGREANERDAIDIALNEVAGKLQIMDVLVPNGEATIAAGEQRPEDQLSVTYTIGSRTSMPSRSDRQGVQIASIPLDAEFYKVATPILTSQVYDEAAATNSSGLVLLPGPVTTYADGRFVGHGELPLVAAGESMRFGLGIDASLRATRELVDRTETTQGGNRIVGMAYELAIENFGAEPAEVRLLERMPYTEDNDVRLTLAESGSGPSDLGEGLLRWDIIAAEGGSTARAYEFTVEYDRLMTLTGLAAAN